MSWVDDLRNGIDEQLDRADLLLDQVERYGPVVIRSALNVYLDTVLHLPFIPADGPLAEAAIARLTEIVAGCRMAVAVQRSMLRQVGSPDRLRAAAAQLADAVSSPAHRLAERMVPGKLESTDWNRWNDGEASSGYARRVVGRDDATRRIAELVDPVGGSLRSMADAIETFYVELGALVTSIVVYVAGLVAAIISLAAAIPTVGASLAPAIAGVIAAGAGWLGIVGSLGAMYVTAQQTTGDIAVALPTKVDPWPAVLT